MKYVIGVTFLFLLLAPALAFAAPDSALLNAPFTSQAPLNDWSWPWADFCEEASIVMSYAYVTGKKYSTYDFAVEMIKLAIFELKTLGYEKDTNLKDTERMLRDFYGYNKSRIVENPTSAFIRGEIAKGNLVIVPAAGALLENPYFRAKPRYHMVVVKGFDHADFIVNEPGTRFGNGFRYSQSNLMDAMHDFVPESQNITTGRKAVVVVEK